MAAMEKGVDAAAQKRFTRRAGEEIPVWAQQAMACGGRYGTGAGYGGSGHGGQPQHGFASASLISGRFIRRLGWLSRPDLSQRAGGWPLFALAGFNWCSPASGLQQRYRRINPVLRWALAAPGRLPACAMKGISVIAVLLGRAPEDSVDR